MKKSHAQKLVAIKETWEIFEIFEAERTQILNDTKIYEAEILKSQEILKNLREKHSTLREENRALEAKKEELNFEIQDLMREKNDQIFRKKIQKIYAEREKISAQKDEILPEKLEKIEVILDDGERAFLAPTRAVYDDELLHRYRVCLKENHACKQKISSLEMENKELKIELRDYFVELNLQQNPPDPKPPKITRKKIKTQEKSEQNERTRAKKS